MAKIPRATHKVFGAAGSTDNFAKFGSLVAGSPVKTKVLATIMSLPAWDNGFQDSIFGSNKDLLLEDLNSFSYEHSTQVGYILQAGIPEWDAGTTYYTGSVVQDAGGLGQWFISLQDNNLGHVPPTGASNAFWSWVNPPQDLVGTATLNFIPKVTDASPAKGIPGSVVLGNSAMSEDGVNVILGKPIKFPDATVQASASAPISNQSVVTGARAFNTVFHNTTGKPMFITVSGSTAGGPVLDAYTDASPTPTTRVAGESMGGSPGSVSISFIVLPGNYYKVNGGGAVVDVWTEWT